MKKVLIACEESQAVTIEMRKLGISAFSCDILPCSGGYPEWHIQDDVTPYLNNRWDAIIAFPPCTYLTVSGNRWFNIDKYGDKAIKRHNNREKAIEFFMRFINAKCDKIAVENPVGVMSTIYRKPDQIIQPWMFGHKEPKKTCLWLKGLPLLKPTNIVEPEYIIGKDGKRYSRRHYLTQFSSEKYYGVDRAMARSKTHTGIAKAMATQWNKYI